MSCECPVNVWSMFYHHLLVFLGSRLNVLNVPWMSCECLVALLWMFWMSCECPVNVHSMFYHHILVLLGSRLNVLWMSGGSLMNVLKVLWMSRECPVNVWWLFNECSECPVNVLWMSCECPANVWSMFYYYLLVLLSSRLNVLNVLWMSGGS